MCIGRFVNLGWDGENFANIGINAAFVRVVEREIEDESITSKSHSTFKLENDSSDDEEEIQKDSESFIE